MARGNHKHRKGTKKNGNKKRGFAYNKTEDESSQKGTKRFKRDGNQLVKPENTVESSDEEAGNNFKQLLSMVAGSSQQLRNSAVLSDDSEIESDEGEKTNSSEDNESVDNSQIQFNKCSANKVDVNSTEDDHPELGNEVDFEIDEDGMEEEKHIPEDPFTRHIQWELDPALITAISAEEPIKTMHSSTWPILGRLITQIPQPVPATTTGKLKVTVQENVTYAPTSTEPKRIEQIDWDQLYVKQQIQGHLEKANTMNSGTEAMTPRQKELFSVFNNYQDIYYPERTHQNGEEIRFTYCLHAVNHILKTRLKVLHHNTRLLKKTEVPDEYRDQGLVRPKVIMLLPFRESALRAVNMIANILLGSTKGVVMNYKRFAEEFGGSELALPRKNPRPEDYEQTFAGNTDDDFRIGITVTKKCLKLYADFYDSDLIIASPLGLRMIVGAEGEATRDYDFLASVEILVADQTDIFLQQNWDHLLHVWDHLHKQPKEAHGADFSRLRLWALAGHARYYRQTLLFSSVSLPEFQALMNRRCHNYAGSVRVANPITVGSICQVVVQVPQVFHRVEVSTPTQAITARFEMFTTKVLPQFRESLMNHSMIFVSNYFDYVRVRNYFKREDISFVQICEYSKEGKIARARDLFFHNETHFLLYSERFHFFRRIRVKGIRHLIFYQPPAYPHFYSEMCNMMQEVNQNHREGGGTESNMSVTVLYCKYDAQRLAGIMGTERASRMLESDRKVHMMVTGD